MKTNKMGMNLIININKRRLAIKTKQRVMKKGQRIAIHLTLISSQIRLLEKFDILMTFCLTLVIG